ncbi:Ephrin_rec_like domain-containing protein [Durusdinium trenchii]|uniref:Ephrin_rec_like domain-containing protein n=1 Tax=Durusdinium trenchii TaxID=1381693 RepID=A0ABP0QUY4_9DINO
MRFGLCSRFRLQHWCVGFILGLAASNPTCLPDAIPPEQRQWMKDNDGQDLPVGLFICAWDSSHLFTRMALILLQEVMGYHAEEHPVVGDSSSNSIYALGGCRDFNGLGSETERGCDQQETRIHIMVDSWIYSYASVLKALTTRYPHLAPVDLGSMGFDGQESIFVSKRDRDEASDREGLSLVFYESYNTTHHDPKRYFDEISLINRSSLKPCNQTNLLDLAFMANYLHWTGDREGLLAVNGGHIGRCDDGFWWLAPSCRSASSTCIPVITAGSGWKLQSIMQWCTEYGMPCAVGVARDSSEWVQIGSDVKSIFYWWIPESGFVHLKPSPIIFPEYNAFEWAQGNERTAISKAYVNKAASSNLKLKAPMVEEFVARMSFNLDETQELLLATRSSSFQEVACDWIKENRQRWMAWIPVSSNCFLGFGMVDSTGTFLTSRSTATDCEVCPPGRFSEAFLDADGATYLCVPCAPGYYQGSSATEACDPCPAGTYNLQWGKQRCDPCGVGTYQDAKGMISCIPCNERTTLFQGGTSEDDCVCKQGLIEDTGLCLSCSTGLQCPKGSTVALLLGQENVTEGQDPPVLQPSFNSAPERPLKVYRCQESCPGGRPGTCMNGRVGWTCSECPVGTFARSNEEPCVQCSENQAAIAAAISCGALFVAPVVFLSYYPMQHAYVAKGFPASVIASMTGEVLNYLQELSVITQAPTAWPALMTETASSVKIFTLNLETLGVGCFATSTGQRYFWHAATFPLVIIVIVVMSLFSRLFGERTFWDYQLRWTWHGTCAMVGMFCQTTFVTMANVGFSPLMCYAHPDGEESVLQFSGIFCWTSEHAAMVVEGMVSLTLSMSFLVLCFWAAYKAPSWSLEKQAAAKFLFVDFRPDHWWYGGLLLFRDLLLSLPSVIAPNSAHVQLVLLHALILISAVMQAYFQPRKTPAMNLVVTVVNCILVTLLGIGLGSIQKDAEATPFLEVLGAIVCIVFFVICGSVFLVFFAAIILEKLGYPALGKRCSNLGNMPESRTLLLLLRILSKGWEKCKTEQEFLIERLEQLGSYDVRMLLKSLVILEAELGIMAPAQSKRSSTPSAVSIQSVFSTVSELTGSGRIKTKAAQNIASMNSALGMRQDTWIATELRKSNSALHFDDDDEPLTRKEDGQDAEVEVDGNDLEANPGGWGWLGG